MLNFHPEEGFDGILLTNGLTKLKETDDRTMVPKALRFWRSCDANVSSTCHNDGHAACKSILFSPVTEARSGWKKAPRLYCCIDRNSTWG